MFFLEHLHKFPFTRFAVPLIGGIACGDFLFSEGEGGLLSLAPFPAVWLLAPLLFVCASFFLKKYSTRWVFGVSVTAFFFLLGVHAMTSHLAATRVSFPGGEAVYRAVITHKPENRERSLLCRASLRVPDASGVGARRKKVLLYFPKGPDSGELKNGDELLFRAELSLPAGSGNPDEFDYPRYLLHKGISGTGYVSAGNWRVTGNNNRFSLQSVASGYRDRIVEKYRQLGFEGDELGILSALTVGYKEELSEDIREAFSVSGASHVLAMSGLHLGIISTMLFFLLKFVPGKSKRVAGVRAAVVIAVLWGFAFISGLSPSIVRSAVMFSLLALSGLRTGKVFSLNTLGVAATAMLLYNPGWLFDVGFQLSFCAVASILLIQPWLHRKVAFSNAVCRHIWGLVTVTLAAQVGTQPFVLLYFNRFPSHFLLTNLLVIPLVTLIIYLAIVMLLATPLPVVQNLIAWPEQTLLGFLVKTVKWVERLPYSTIDNIWISRPEVAIYFVALLALTGFILKRRASYLMFFLAGCIFITGFRTYTVHSNRPDDSIVVYNLRDCPVVHCITSQRDSWLVYADSLDGRSERRLSRTAGNYWNRLRLASPQPVPGDFDNKLLARKGDLLCFADKRLLMINDNQWDGKKSADRFVLDYLYISKGYTGRIGNLLDCLSFDNVILDSSLSAYQREKLTDECRSLGINCVSATQGAMIIRC